MIIAVDAMGGDNAPEVVVHGALQACEELNCNIILVGDSAAVSPHLENCINREGVAVHNCSEVVEMGESPMKAYKNKKDSSIRVAFKLLKSGKADAVVVVCNDILLADALATALGNKVKSPDHVEKVIKQAENFQEIQSLLIICEDKIGIKGDNEIKILK